MEGLPDSADYWRKVAEEPLDEAFAKVLRTADLPQVALKWAHTGVMFDAAGYPNLAARPFLRRALDAFGADRATNIDIGVVKSGKRRRDISCRIRPHCT
jgi:hypothetical protein